MYFVSSLYFFKDMGVSVLCLFLVNRLFFFPSLLLFFSFFFLFSLFLSLKISFLFLHGYDSTWQLKAYHYFQQ